MTNDEQGVSGIYDRSRNTATNDLRDLTRKLILEESGKKRAGSYHAIAQ